MEGSSESQSLKLKPQTLMARSYLQPATFNEKAKSVSKEKCGQSEIGVASMTSTARCRMEAKLAQLCLNRVRKEEELTLGVLAAEQEKRRLESQRRMLEAEAEAAEASIIADAASSCGDRMSQVNDVAPSMESREKVDVFLHSITRNNDEPDFDQNHGASATAAQEWVLDRFFPPLGGAAGWTISSSSSRADGPDFLRFFLGPVPQQLFHDRCFMARPNGAVRTRPMNPPERERYNPRLITEARSPARKRDTGSQSAGESFTLCDVAKMLVQCRGSESISQLNKFYGDPLEYFKFIRHIEDRILSIYEKSDPGQALYLLLEATGGQAHKLISSCVMLVPERGLSEALHLLHKTFGSPQVAVRSFIESVCNESPIVNAEVGLQNFYSDLINCKIVLEAVGAHNLLNAASTAEKIFLRLPHALQEGFVKVAAERGFDLDVVPFDLFIEYVDININ